MVEVGVWAIIAKVRTIRRQQQYLTDLQGESGGILLGDGHRHWGASSIFHGEGGKALRCVLARYNINCSIYLVAISTFVVDKELLKTVLFHCRRRICARCVKNRIVKP